MDNFMGNRLNKKMDNSDIAEVLEETAKLMELHGENPFKIRSYQRAALHIDRLKEHLSSMSNAQVEAVEGIGQSMALKIASLLKNGSLDDLEELRKKTPDGVRRMLKIKGLGPKKVGALWKELQIESTGELLYACNENRLIELKGFGAKTQDQIRKTLEFANRQEGYFHFATAEKAVNQMLEMLFPEGIPNPFIFTGPFRRKCEVVTSVDVLITDEVRPQWIEALENASATYTHTVEEENNTIRISSPEGILIHIQYCGSSDFTLEGWFRSGSNLHTDACLAHSGKSISDLAGAQDEYEIYARLNLPYFEPEWREGLGEVQRAANGTLPDRLVKNSDLKGILHCHTTYSDGKHSLEEMATACRDAGYAYFGVCDHSKSAFYAGGLSIERVQAQQSEIRKLNEKLAPFRILSGIESDILADGSLDYPDEILATFDFVVASVHSGLRMDREKATERILKAIQNPFTTILGHPTGRLLLSREGYPLDYERIFAACAEHKVVVELNAHPYRLDLDWRFIAAAVDKGLLISINPDAHSTAGLHDMRFGVLVGRKGFLQPENTFNAMTTTQLLAWLEEKKKTRPS